MTFDTVKLEAKHIRLDFGILAAGLDVWLLASEDTWIQVGGGVFELATLVERHETGNWEIALDESECQHDHLAAQQKIDQYTV